MSHYYLNLQIKIVFGILFLFPLFFSCGKEETSGKYTDGVFIANEGGFESNNGSVSFYSYNADSVYNDIFFDVNHRSLGDVVQSVTIHDGKVYIVVNNSNKIEIADRQTFKENGVITGLSSPRYLAAFEKMAFVSCWGDNTVKIINLETNSIVESIPVGAGPDKMCIVNNKLYVANTGGWATDSLISVIDIATYELIKNISVKYSPYDMVIDNENNIWALCYGKVIYDTEDPYPIIEESPSKIYKIDTESDEPVLEIVLFDDQHPWHLEISNDGELFFGGGYSFQGIYHLAIESEDVTRTQIISDYVYGFNIDPGTNIFFIMLAPTFTEPGMLKRYSKEGELLGTYDCGIGPKSAAFK